MSSRRDFIKTMLAAGATLAVPGFAKGSVGGKTKRIVILQTNDSHSQIDPLPESHHRFPGQGGFAARAALINKIRGEGFPVLLFDSGDIFQGTPYYNMYGGEVEMKLMSEMNYDAATIGNHEFDKGLDGLADAMEFATFPFISSNYVFKHPRLSKAVKKYKIFSFGKIKVGVFGLGVYPYGLINSLTFGDTEYTDPVLAAAEMAHKLKKEEKCSMVVCLSHLGYKADDSGHVADFELAKQSKNIDLILGGHSHTLLSKPVSVYNSDNEQVIITQNAYAGVRMSRIDCYFSGGGNLIFVDAYTNNIFKKQA
ncbi:Trifunctional nucleotide phosphoesterase protein YfkN [bioreactor metagenome]|uniref:Trifunctional nucleotide phosphoesterase protein YfkN n=1 Tax=bioreactor metagenome TaxID=1076179 RepID=A0A644XZ88_9ZZZZ